MTVEKRLRTVLSLEPGQFSRGLLRARGDLRDFHEDNIKQAKRAAIAMAGVAGVAVLIGKQVREAFRNTREANEFGKTLESLGSALTRTWGEVAGPQLARMNQFFRDNLPAIVGGFRDILGAVQALLAPFTALVGFMVQHGNAVRTAATAAALLAAQMWLVAAAQVAVNTAMRANPILLLIQGVLFLANVAVVGLVNKIGGWEKAILRLKYEFARLIPDWIRAWDLLRFEVVKFVDLVKTNFESAWTIIQSWADNVKKILGAVGEALREPWNVSKWKGVWDEARAGVVDFGRTVVDEGRTMATSMWQPLSPALQRELVSIESKFQESYRRLQDDYAKGLEDIETRRRNAAAGYVPGKTDTSLRAGVTALPLLEKGPTFDALFEEELRKLRVEYQRRINEDKHRVGVTAPALLLDLKTPTFEAMNNEEMKSWRDAQKAQLRDYVRSLDEFRRAGVELYRGMWDAFLDIEMTGKRRREALWASALSSFRTYLQNSAQNWIFSEEHMANLKAFFERKKTIAAATGSAERQVVAGQEIATSQLVTSQAATEAAAKINAAHAWLPFVGVAIAAGFIGYMIAQIRSTRAQKFALGGLVDGQSGPDRVPALLTRGEFVMPAAQTQRYLPMLEAMRAGQGAGGGTTVHVHLPSGSVLLADDQRAVDRWAQRIQRALERRPTYRPLPAGGAA